MFKLNANILPKHSDIHNYSTRNNNKFIAPKCNMRKSEMSINFKSIKVWNKLPADIRTSDSLNVFMDNLGTTFFHDTEFITDVFFYFLRYALSLCNVLPTIGQYSIDISIKYSFRCLKGDVTLASFDERTREFTCRFHLSPQHRQPFSHF